MLARNAHALNQALPRVLPLVVASLGVAFVGRGWLNGDAAAYAAQAEAADLWGRATHVGYVAVAATLAPWSGAHLGLALDVLGLVAAGGAALAVSHRARLYGPAAAALAGIAAAAALLPWAPFAEVDPLWVACVLLAVAGVPGAMAAAVAISPVALLAVPWAIATRAPPEGPSGRLRALSLVVEAGVAVGVLTVASTGDWWVGPRGVLTHAQWLPGRSLEAWARHVPWLLVAVRLGGPRDRGGWRLLALLPLLAAPPDVPAFMLGGAAVGLWAAEAWPRASLLWRGAAGLAALAYVGQGWGQADARARRVAQETAVVAHVAAQWSPHHGLVAPWTWGARVACAVSGDPYGVPWHPPGRWLRHQREQWERARPQRIGFLPPREGCGEPDAYGVRWVAADGSELRRAWSPRVRRACLREAEVQCGARADGRSADPELLDGPCSARPSASP